MTRREFIRSISVATPSIAVLSVRDPAFLGRNRGGASGPDAIAGMRVWYDGTDASTMFTDAGTTPVVNDGDKIQRWTDKSGNGLNTNDQVTELNKPFYRLNVVNGLSAIQFGPSVASIFTLPDLFTGMTEGEVFFTLKVDNDPPGAPSGCTPWLFPETSDISAYPYLDGMIYDGVMSTVRKTVGNPAQALDAWHYYNVSSGSGVWTARINGTQIFTTGTNTFKGSGAFTRCFGCSLNYAGYLSEVLLYDHILSTDDRTAVHDYITGKYGLS